mgnify:CR=1 FL=1
MLLVAFFNHHCCATLQNVRIPSISVGCQTIPIFGTNNISVTLIFHSSTTELNLCPLLLLNKTRLCSGFVTIYQETLQLLASALHITSQPAGLWLFTVSSLLPT